MGIGVEQWRAQIRGSRQSSYDTTRPTAYDWVQLLGTVIKKSKKTLETNRRIDCLVQDTLDDILQQVRLLLQSSRPTMKLYPALVQTLTSLLQSFIEQCGSQISDGHLVSTIAWLERSLLMLASDVETSPSLPKVGNQKDVWSIEAIISIGPTRRGFRSKGEQDSSLRRRLRSELVCQLNKPNSLLRRRLMGDYNLALLSAQEGPVDSSFQFSFRANTKDGRCRLREASKDGTLSSLMARLLKLLNVTKTWELLFFLDFEEENDLTQVLKTHDKPVVPAFVQDDESFDMLQQNYGRQFLEVFNLDKAWLVFLKASGNPAVHDEDLKGSNALYLAVVSGSFGAVRSLTERCVSASYGIDPLYRNNEGKTCLMVAAESGDLKTVEFLLNNYEYNLNDLSNQRRSVFHCVADKGHADVAKFLLEKGRTLGLIPEILNRKDLHRVEQLCSFVRGIAKGRAAWHYVKMQRKYLHFFQKYTKGSRVDASKVGTILQSGWGQEPDVDICKRAVERYKEAGRTTEGIEDLTPLMLALVEGNIDVAKLYIEAGGNVHTRDCFGQTGMHLCAMRGTLETAALLEEAGLGLNGEDNGGDQPIRTAEMNGHPELVNFFKWQEQLPIVQNFVNGLCDVQEKLSANRLQEIRRSGQDTNQHYRRTLHGLNSETNGLLQALGSGPVVEASEDE